MSFRPLSSFTLAACTLLFAHTPAQALVREFPANSRQVNIQAVKDPYLTASGKTYHMAPGLIIFNANNLTIVRNALPAGVTARIQLDLNGDLRRVWILNAEEIGAPASPSLPSDKAAATP